MHASGMVRGDQRRRHEDGQPAMTAPYDSSQYLPPAATPPPWTPPVSPPRRRRAGLIAALVAGVLVLMAATGAAVWFATRPAGTAPAAAASSTAAGSSLAAAGALTLQRGQFVWSGATCQGLGGYDDLAAGTQVTVTDATGKVVAIGALETGTPQGISTTNGLPQASLCELKFSVPGVPRGAGPYGVEVAHRGVVHVDEGHLGIIQLGL